MKNDKKEHSSKRRPSDLPVSMNSSCIELSGNREAIIEGSKGILEYSPDIVRVNTSGMIISVCGRELDLRCISPSALIIDGFISSIEFSV